jgi:hypothetical protein
MTLTRMVVGIKDGWMAIGAPVNQPIDIAKVIAGIVVSGPGREAIKYGESQPAAGADGQKCWRDKLGWPEQGGWMEERFMSLAKKDGISKRVDNGAFVIRSRAERCFGQGATNPRHWRKLAQQ